MLTASEPVLTVLELARWAPSADNTQPWRFEVLSPSCFAVHFHDTRTNCVYDLDGRISQIAWGAMLESIAIAATSIGCRADIIRRSLGTSSSDTRATFDVSLVQDASVAKDALVDHIEARATQRRCLSPAALSSGEKAALDTSVGSDFHVTWSEGWGERLRQARLLWLNGRARLILPEAFDTHRDSIQWSCDRSIDRIPAEAIGLDPILLRVTEWAFRSWARVDFLNRYLAGTWMARVELDLLPALLCGAHFCISSKSALKTMADFVEGGRAVQRFWLTAQSLRLRLQPTVSALVFARYVAEQTPFTTNSSAQLAACEVARLVETRLGGKTEREATVFAGRLGRGAEAKARSLRHPVEFLCRPTNDEVSLNSIQSKTRKSLP